MSTTTPAVKAENKPAVQAKQPITFGNTGVQLATFEDAYRFSTAVAQSGWAPKGMEKPESVLVAIQFGLEIGLSPMAALQNTAVINGRPGIYGDAALALVRSSGLCLRFSEAETNDECDVIFRELQFALVEGDTQTAKDLSKKLALAQAKLKVDADDFGVTCAALRDGNPLEFGRFTVADAKQAALWRKQGPWTQYPKRMLKFRARGFLLRDVFGDVLKGLKTTEELQDIPIEPRNVTPGRDGRSLAEMLDNPVTVPEVVTPVDDPSTGVPNPEQSAANMPADRDRVVEDLKDLMLNNEVSEDRLWKYVVDGKHAPEGVDELWALPTNILEKLRAAVPAISSKKGGK